MKNYIVLDLEWNQSAHGKADSVEDFPFEIIEIGAVKLDEHLSMVDEFHRLIRPQVYTQMHYAISEVTHMSMGELRSHGEDFVTAAAAFFDWCGDESLFCTWGSMDLTELQRNLRYFGMEDPFPKPLFYYDVQKLYGLFCNEGVKPSLDAAVEELGLIEDRPFHRALEDAYYTGRVLEWMGRTVGADRFLPFRSIDYYRLPETPEEEVLVVFPTYSKYVSRIFSTKEDALKDKAVTVTQCYVCGRTLRKKVQWFTANQKVYYGLAVCPEHGYLKGKIRMKRVDDVRVYVVKTLKLTDEDGAEKIMGRKENIRRKRSERNRAKRRRQRKARTAADKD